MLDNSNKQEGSLSGNAYNYNEYISALFFYDVIDSRHLCHHNRVGTREIQFAMITEHKNRAKQPDSNENAEQRAATR